MRIGSLWRTSELARGPREISRSPRPLRGKRAAFFASYGDAPIFSKSVVELTRALTARGYDIVLIRASNSGVRTEWPANEEAIRPTIIWRPNLGYDFGSWTLGIHTFPRLARREYVLLVNDSLVGPFGPIDEMLDHFEATSADVWAGTSTLQYEPHLQSFVLGFRRGELSHYPLNRFWDSIQELGEKEQIIQQYEIGLSSLLDREMLTTTAFQPAETIVRGELNPAIDGWERLLENNFPFVKRELLRLDSHAKIKEKIIAKVRDRYGVDPMDWFEDV